MTAAHKIITLGTSHGDPTLERFNSSTLLECNGKRYLLDAGAPAAALLIRRGIAIQDLQGIFLTHMHEDHFGGLSGLLKHIVKYPPASPVPVFLPEDRADVFLALLAASHRPASEKHVQFHVIRPGKIFDDGNISMEAVRTDHAANEKGTFPSYAFSIHRQGAGHYLHTGDLRSDFADFPAAYCTPETTCVCELTHYPWHCAEPVLKNIRLKKLIFAHIGNQWRSDTGFDLPYPAVIANDGDEFPEDMIL